MSTDITTIRPEADITKAVQLLLDKGFNGVPVVDEAGRLVGILCQSDLVRLQKSLPIPSLFTLLDGIVPLSSSVLMEAEVKRIAASRVADAMTDEVTTVSPDTDLETIAGLMVDRQYHTLPVVEDGHLVGVIGMKDIIKTLLPSS